ncbi:nitrous oxide reductase accessory protein NosL [Paenibacillus puerhi]|uniref:nitrous oxide reductase accessory protein NosL n=1 Tax=Paenibacillus puerhi TaxID=2692622 RepID=UPI0013587327|nr:nitrous oxide reductase accessory protein NosL [Paenibacillus puerhi]
MSRQVKLFITAFFLVVILAGCGAKEKFPALAINEAVDKCAICNMQVKDDAFATQLTTTDGKNYKFDDLGCMNEWKQKNSTAAIGAQYVRDYNNKDWIAFDQATYVYDASFKTPMAYGIYTFKDKAEAQKFVDTQKKGKVMTAAELATHTWEQSKGAMDSHSHGHGAESGGAAKTDDKGMHGK